MGIGYGFKCTKCHRKYKVFLGTGMMYPDEYRSVLAKVAKGWYGLQLRRLYKSSDYAALDASRVIYICERCRKWKKGIDLTLYAPNNPKEIAHTKYGENTVEELGYVPYITDSQLKNDYHILKRYNPKCKRCRQRMRKITWNEAETLPCPRCRKYNIAECTIYWD